MFLGNAQSFAIKYQGISKKAKTYSPDESIYENTRPLLKPKPIEHEEIYENTGFHKQPVPPSPVVRTVFFLICYVEMKISTNFLMNKLYQT